MRTKIEDQAIFLIPETDLVASRIEELRDFFSERMEARPEIDQIVLDVHGIDIVDSLGVNLIVGLYRQAAAEGKDIEIIGAGEKFMKVASFFRLTTILSISREEER